MNLTHLTARAHWLWREWGRPLAIALVIVLPLRSSIADWYEVPSGSMKPTIIEGDRIFVNKLAYDLKVPFTRWRVVTWNTPERGDIVVFPSPVDGTRLVKRVVGLPGDMIAMHDNKLYVNGRPVEYEPLDDALVAAIAPAQRSHHRFLVEELPGSSHPVMLTPGQRALSTFPPLVVPPDQYFVMGDNRDNSADSRYIGFIDRERILGKATTVVLSFNYDNHHIPRWQRFFRDL